MNIAENLDRLRTRIAQAAIACGRKSEEVRLVAVSKKQPLSAILAAYEAGQRDFAENYAQELAAKALLAPADICWHFIGPLQSNKVNIVLRHATVIHTIHSLAVAEAVSKRCVQETSVLIQVNLGREAQKNGVLPEAALALVEQVRQLPKLRVVGLMGMPPDGVEPLPYFKTLQALGPTGELSMGMSHDFEAAIACGATMVRLGTAIFGERVSEAEGL